METQLLCTFCLEEALDKTIDGIVQSYDVAFNTIYVLQNMETENSLCLTYNVVVKKDQPIIIPEATISLHRKKATNTLYTINALNMLIAELNGGRISKDYKINWSDYQNMILVTAYGKLKKIRTQLKDIVRGD